jgi:hypothetical protein
MGERLGTMENKLINKDEVKILIFYDNNNNG